MDARIATGLIMTVCWTLFRLSFSRDRSRYRNCYLLFIALASVIPFLLSLSGTHRGVVAVVIADAVLLSLLIVPFFLIHNGIVMLRREGRQLSHMLSLALGLAILIGEAATVVFLVSLLRASPSLREAAFHRTVLSVASAVVSVTVIYGSMAFLIFMIYTLFLQIIPKKKDFDYVIIHGAGLIDGERISQLLKDRLDKAIDVYRKDPSPTRLIPSGGKGADERVSEAEAMKRYLLERGVPETDILTEDASTTTYENLKNSSRIIGRMPGRRYTALVTSNYHVYRALRYCREIGLSCTGIGSRVAFYYWPSALIREFIAIHAEKKHAAQFLAGWIVCMAGLAALILIL